MEQRENGGGRQHAKPPDRLSPLFNDNPPAKDDFLDERSGADRIEGEQPRHARLLRGDIESDFPRRFTREQDERPDDADDYRGPRRIDRARQGIPRWMSAALSATVIIPQSPHIYSCRG